MAFDCNNPWCQLIDGEYRRFYGRGVTEAELWPIATLMQQGVRQADGTVRGLTTAEIDALIIAQSGPPLTQGSGPPIVKQPAPGTGDQPPAPLPKVGPPGVACAEVMPSCRPWERVATGVNGCPTCVVNPTVLLAGAGAAVGLFVLARRR